MRRLLLLPGISCNAASLAHPTWAINSKGCNAPDHEAVAVPHAGEMRAMLQRAAFGAPSPLRITVRQISSCSTGAAGNVTDSSTLASPIATADQACELQSSATCHEDRPPASPPAGARVSRFSQRKGATPPGGSLDVLQCEAAPASAGDTNASVSKSRFSRRKGTTADANAASTRAHLAQRTEREINAAPSGFSRSRSAMGMRHTPGASPWSRKGVGDGRWAGRWRLESEQRSGRGAGSSQGRRGSGARGGRGVTRGRGAASRHHHASPRACSGLGHSERQLRRGGGPRASRENAGGHDPAARVLSRDPLLLPDLALDEAGPATPVAPLDNGLSTSRRPLKRFTSRRGQPAELDGAAPQPQSTSAVAGSASRFVSRRRHSTQETSCPPDAQEGHCHASGARLSPGVDPPTAVSGEPQRSDGQLCEGAAPECQSVPHRDESSPGHFVPEYSLYFVSEKSFRERVKPRELIIPMPPNFELQGQLPSGMEMLNLATDLPNHCKLWCSDSYRGGSKLPVTPAVPPSPDVICEYLGRLLLLLRCLRLSLQSSSVSRQLRLFMTNTGKCSDSDHQAKLLETLMSPESVEYILTAGANFQISIYRSRLLAYAVMWLFRSLRRSRNDSDASVPRSDRFQPLQLARCASSLLRILGDTRQARASKEERIRRKLRRAKQSGCSLDDLSTHQLCIQCMKDEEDCLTHILESELMGRLGRAVEEVAVAAPSPPSFTKGAWRGATNCTGDAGENVKLYDHGLAGNEVFHLSQALSALQKAAAMGLFSAAASGRKQRGSRQHSKYGVQQGAAAHPSHKAGHSLPLINGKLFWMAIRRFSISDQQHFYSRDVVLPVLHFVTHSHALPLVVKDPDSCVTHHDTGASDAADTIADTVVRLLECAIPFSLNSMMYPGATFFGTAHRAPDKKQGFQLSPAEQKIFERILAQLNKQEATVANAPDSQSNHLPTSSQEEQASIRATLMQSCVFSGVFFHRAMEHRNGDLCGHTAPFQSFQVSSIAIIYARILTYHSMLASASMTLNATENMEGSVNRKPSEGRRKVIELSAETWMPLVVKRLWQHDDLHPRTCLAYFCELALTVLQKFTFSDITSLLAALSRIYTTILDEEKQLFRLRRAVNQSTDQQAADNAAECTLRTAKMEPAGGVSQFWGLERVECCLSALLDGCVTIFVQYLPPKLRRAPAAPESPKVGSEKGPLNKSSGQVDGAHNGHVHQTWQVLSTVNDAMKNKGLRDYRTQRAIAASELQSFSESLQRLSYKPFSDLQGRLQSFLVSHFGSEFFWEELRVRYAPLIRSTEAGLAKVESEAPLDAPAADPAIDISTSVPQQDSQIKASLLMKPSQFASVLRLLFRYPSGPSRVLFMNVKRRLERTVWPYAIVAWGVGECPASGGTARQLAPSHTVHDVELAQTVAALSSSTSPPCANWLHGEYAAIVRRFQLLTFEEFSLLLFSMVPKLDGERLECVESLLLRSTQRVLIESRGSESLMSLLQYLTASAYVVWGPATLTADKVQFIVQGIDVAVRRALVLLEANGNQLCSPTTTHREVDIASRVLSSSAASLELPFIIPDGGEHMWRQSLDTLFNALVMLHAITPGLETRLRSDADRETRALGSLSTQGELTTIRGLNFIHRYLRQSFCVCMVERDGGAPPTHSFRPNRAVVGDFDIARLLSSLPRACGNEGKLQRCVSMRGPSCDPYGADIEAAVRPLCIPSWMVPYFCAQTRLAESSRALAASFAPLALLESEGDRAAQLALVSAALDRVASHTWDFSSLTFFLRVIVPQCHLVLAATSASHEPCVLTEVLKERVVALACDRVKHSGRLSDVFYLLTVYSRHPRVRHEILHALLPESFWTPLRTENGAEAGVAPAPETFSLGANPSESTLSRWESWKRQMLPHMHQFVPFPSSLARRSWQQPDARAKCGADPQSIPLLLRLTNDFISLPSTIDFLASLSLNPFSVNTSGPPTGSLDLPALTEAEIQTSTEALLVLFGVRAFAALQPLVDFENLDSSVVVLYLLTYAYGERVPSAGSGILAHLFHDLLELALEDVTHFRAPPLALFIAESICDIGTAASFYAKLNQINVKQIQRSGTALLCLAERAGAGAAHLPRKNIFLSAQIKPFAESESLNVVTLLMLCRKHLCNTVCAIIAEGRVQKSLTLSECRELVSFLHSRAKGAAPVAIPGQDQWMSQGSRAVLAAQAAVAECFVQCIRRLVGYSNGPTQARLPGPCASASCGYPVSSGGDECSGPVDLWTADLADINISEWLTLLLTQHSGTCAADDAVLNTLLLLSPRKLRDALGSMDYLRLVCSMLDRWFAISVGRGERHVDWSAEANVRSPFFPRSSMAAFRAVAREEMQRFADGSNDAAPLQYNNQPGLPVDIDLEILLRWCDWEAHPELNAVGHERMLRELVHAQHAEQREGKLVPNPAFTVLPQYCVLKVLKSGLKSAASGVGAHERGQPTSAPAPCDGLLIRLHMMSALLDWSYARMQLPEDVVNDVSWSLGARLSVREGGAVSETHDPAGSPAVQWTDAEQRAIWEVFAEPSSYAFVEVMGSGPTYQKNRVGLPCHSEFLALQQPHDTRALRGYLANAEYQLAADVVHTLWEWLDIPHSAIVVARVESLRPLDLSRFVLLYSCLARTELTSKTTLESGSRCLATPFASSSSAKTLEIIVDVLADKLQSCRDEVVVAVVQSLLPLLAAPVGMGPAKGLATWPGCKGCPEDSFPVLVSSTRRLLARVPLMIANDADAFTRKSIFELLLRLHSVGLVAEAAVTALLHHFEKLVGADGKTREENTKGKHHVEVCSAPPLGELLGVGDDTDAYWTDRSGEVSEGEEKRGDDEVPEFHGHIVTEPFIGNSEAPVEPPRVSVRAGPSLLEQMETRDNLRISVASLISMLKRLKWELEKEAGAGESATIGKA